MPVPFRIVAMLVLLAGCVHAFAYRAFQPDDAFIFLVYAKNFLAGSGLTFNGEVVEGFSSALWTFLLVIAGLPRFDLLTTAKVLGLALYLATGILLAVMARRIPDAGERRWPAATPCLLAIVFSMPLLALWAPGGMETILHAFLITLACWLYFKASIDTQRARDHVLAGIAFGLLAWTRPEGFAFIGAIPAFEISKLLVRRRASVKHALLTVATACALIAVLLAWRYSTYHDFLPVTVAAKTGNLAAQWHAGKDYVARFAAQYAVYVVAYALATAVLLWRGGRSAWWAWLALIVVTGETAFSALVGGDWMMGFRFLVPVVPIALLVIFLALQRWRILAVLGSLVLVAVGVNISVPLNRAAMQQAQSDLGDVRMGEYIRDLHLPPQSRIAVIDAGAIPYYAGLPTIDMVGLNNAHIARLPGGFMGKWDNEYVLAQKPEVVQFHTYYKDGAVYPAEVFLGTMRLFYSPEFQRWYEHDPKSPVAHLFRRRAAPLADTWMDSFFDANLQGRLDAAGRQLSLDLEKTGEGVWLAPTEPRMVGGAVYLRTRWMSADGRVGFEQHTPLPRDLRQSGSVHLEIAMPASEHPQLQACIVLAGIGESPRCATFARP